MADAELRTDVIVIGGGVIGLACTYALLEAGRSVRVLERDVLGSGASHGNCGLITPSHALPLTRPGLVRQLLRWMWRSDAPIYVRPRFDPALFGWGLRLLRSCGSEAMLRSLRGRAALLESSRDLFVELIEKEGLSCGWETVGLLEVFATAKAREEAAPVHRLLAEHGVESESYSRGELLELEPALRDDVDAGCWYPRDARLRPEELISELARVVRAQGARIEEGCAVRGFELDGARVGAVSTDAARFHADQVVVAAGAWTTALGRPVGLRLPVQPGKGYSVTTSRPDRCPHHSLLLHEASVAVTPWKRGYRLGGTMEFSGFDERLSRPRLEALRAGARRYLREPYGTEVEEEWCGWRPMTPDELPIIDRAPRFANVMVATGHGMMGVSMAPATGRLVAEMITGVEPFVDPAPYALARF